MELTRELTFKYLSGELAADEEKWMFTLLRDGRNMERFREWEEEWCHSAGALGISDKEWGRMKRRMEIRSSARESLRKGAKRRMWFRVAAAVAAVALLATGISLYHKPEPGEYFAFEAPVGSRCRVVLPDSSVVWLNSGSRLVVPERFNGRSRDVQLSGEGYFEVVRDGEAPFSVQADVCRITVLGTKFNITAYDSDAFIRASVLDGQVELIAGNHSLKLAEGVSVEYDKGSGQFRRLDLSESCISAWRDKRIEFPDIKLRDLANIVSRNYNVRIVFLSERYADERLSISLRNNETIEEILEGIRRVLPVKATFEDDTIYLQ